jgi:hypothetical protein
MGIGHGDRRRVFGRGGQQHRWRRIAKTCTDSECVGNRRGRRPLDYYVDALLRPNPAVNQSNPDVGAARREIAGI